MNQTRQSLSSSAVRSGHNRGTNQSGVRLYNERLVLSLIRTHSSLPKADLARMTHLSPQTVSIIVNALEADGLLLRGSPRRGKVGQPLVPYALNPRGAFFLGLKVGRRSSDMVLLDFTGHQLGRIHSPHSYPTPEGTVDLAQRGIEELAGALSGEERNRIAGIGIAAPFEIWKWESQFGAPPDVRERWRRTDLPSAVAKISPWQVYFHNDATAACAAELVLGTGMRQENFLYIFIGSFIGGGVVINGHLLPGRTGYAGAIAPLPVPLPQGGFNQLMKSGSIYVLAERLAEEGHDPGVLWRDPDDWGELGEPVDGWIDTAGTSIGLACVSAASIIDFSHFVIDGACPRAVLNRLVARIRTAVDTFDRQGLAPFEIVAGTIGSAAREIGGACLPLLANFSQDREVLFKDAAT